MALVKVTEIKQAVHEAAKKTNNTATRALRQRARQAGWSSEAAVNIDVLGDTVVSLSPQAEDAEYGTIHAGPNPVVRGSEGLITSHFENAVRDELKKKGLVL